MKFLSIAEDNECKFTLLENKKLKKTCQKLDKDEEEDEKD